MAETQKKQLNVEIPTDHALKLKIDALNLGVSLSSYAEIAFQKFLTMPIALRRAAFVSTSKKTVGAKIKA